MYYRERRLDASYRADFVCFDSVLVELKALPGLTKKEESQLLNYLKASSSNTGLLLNFGTHLLECKRRVV